MTMQTLTYRCPHCNGPVEVEAHAGKEVMVCPHENCGKPFQVEIPSAEPISATALPSGTAAVVAQPAPTEAAPTDNGKPAPVPQAQPVAAVAAAQDDQVVETVHPV